VDSGEVVIDRMNSNHCRVIIKLLAKAIGQAGESAHSHPHRQVVPFHVGRTHMLRVGIAAHHFQFTADATRRGVAPGFLIGGSAVLRERFARNGAIVRLLNKFPDPPNRDVGEGLNTAFEKMHQLGFKEPSIEERDTDVLITIRHELLASPEETIMKFLEKNGTIRNKQAREITHIRDSDRMKRILSTMADKGLIEGVPGAQFGGMKYRKKQTK